MLTFVVLGALIAWWIIDKGHTLTQKLWFTAIVLGSWFVFAPILLRNILP